MNREEIIRMAREAGFRDTTTPVVALGVSWEQVQRFAALVAAAEREKLAAWMMRQGYATGHGDTTEDLLKQLDWQIAERIRNECEECAKVCEDIDTEYEGQDVLATWCAAAIRARGQA
jgi:hypothetical protein